MMMVIGECSCYSLGTSAAQANRLSPKSVAARHRCSTFIR